jgi:hypothetical protein
LQFNTPNRKRHSSQHLEREAKDAHMHSGAHPVTPLQFQELTHQNRNPNPSVQSNTQAKGAFKDTNEKAMRQEIEIALESMNSKTFRGSLTCPEVKHYIYKECLGFEDFDHFDGVRFGFSVVPII